MWVRRQAVATDPPTGREKDGVFAHERHKKRRTTPSRLCLILVHIARVVKLTIQAVKVSRHLNLYKKKVADARGCGMNAAHVVVVCA